MPAPVSDAVPSAVSVALLRHESSGALKYATKQGWALVAVPEELSVEVKLKHPKTGTALHLRGAFDGYKGLPPAWQFLGPDGRPNLAFAPKGESFNGISSIFIKHQPKPGQAEIPVICAQFNRLAYSDYGGPHSNWGSLLGWQNVDNAVRATTLGDMLSVIRMHLAKSAGCWL